VLELFGQTELLELFSRMKNCHTRNVDNNMKIQEFRKVIKEREACHEEWTFGIEQCWKREIELLIEDVPSTIAFLRNDCTAEEFSWISEILEDIVEIVPCKELIMEYKSLMEKFPEECSKYNIAECIQQTEAMLEWNDKHGKEN